MNATVLAGLGCKIFSLHIAPFCYVESFLHFWISLIISPKFLIFFLTSDQYFYEFLNRISTINTTLTQKKKILFEGATNAREDSESSVAMQ